MTTKVRSIFGRIYLAPVVNGVVGALRDTNVVTEFTTNFTEEEKSFKNPKGEKLASYKLIPDAKCSMTLGSTDIENMALALRSAVVTVPAGTKTLTISRDIEAGEVISLGHLDISNVTSTGLTVGEDFKVLDAGTGLVQMLTAKSGGLTFTFSHAAYKATGFFNGAQQEFYVLVSGEDLANASEPVVAEFYRVKFGGAEELAFVGGSDFNTLTLAGDILVDTSKASDAVFGQYGSYKARA